MKIKILILSLVVLVCTLAIPASVFAYYTYISYITGNDSQITDIYGANWSAQTFTVPNNSVVISSVNMRVYRTGLPGNSSISIRATDINGKPSGGDLIISYYNMSTVNNSSAGAIINATFNASYKLAHDTKYAIVFRSTSGNNSNESNWNVDATAPSYTGGSIATSSDSGASWTLNTSADAMFEIVGLPIINDITEVKVFKNVFESNDRLFVISYNVSYPVLPSESPNDLFDIILYGYSQRPLLTFGTGVSSIYTNALNSPAWGSAQTIWLDGESIYFNSSIRDIYTTSDGEYISSEDTDQGKQQLYDYMLILAARLQITNNETYIFESVDYGDVLNAKGCILFEQAIPGVGNAFPIIGNILAQISSGITEQDFVYISPAVNTSLDISLMGKLGTMTDDAFDGLGSYLGVSGGFLKVLFAFFLYAIIASIIFLVSGNSIAAIVLALPAILFGVYIGMIPPAIIFSIAFLGFLSLMYFLWVRGQ